MAKAFYSRTISLNEEQEKKIKQAIKQGKIKEFSPYVLALIMKDLEGIK